MMVNDITCINAKNDFYQFEKKGYVWYGVADCDGNIELNNPVKDCDYVDYDYIYNELSLLTQSQKRKLLDV